jgi:dihydrofolate synthase/folylpolyglutamate synthase
MLSKYFSLGPKDNEHEEKLESLFGQEAFHGHDYQRMLRHFASYKNLFESLKLPIVIVGGTNGKGETSLYLEKLCVESGIDCFLWSSPHILSVRERFSFQGRPVSSLELQDIFQSLEADSLELSYYEFLFKCFCEFVKRSQVKGKKSLIILEVGLGGRLDATNFFDSSVSILTSISRDHTRILGNSLEAILSEKIEITRSGTHLFSAVSQGFLKEKISAYCEEKKVNLHDTTGLMGPEHDFHQRNEILAREAFSHLVNVQFKVSIDAKLISLGEVWGRPLKVTYKGCQFILLGSHNLDGLRHLARWAFKAQSEKDVRKLVFDQGLFGFSRQEEGELVECLKIIGKSPCLGLKRRLFAFSHQRATSKDLLQSAFSQLGERELTGFTLENEFQGFIEGIKQDQTILVSGSYYFISFFIHSLFQLGSPKFN